MIDELLDLVVRFNLVLAAAILAVLALRAPVRRAFGARIAYALWLIPLLAALTCFAPQRTEIVSIASAHQLQPPPLAISSAPAPPPAAPGFEVDIPPVLLGVWAGGVLFSLLILALRQRRFTRSLGRLAPRGDWGAGVYGAETAEAGPAVIGVLRPLIVTPADFDHRFSDEERAIVIAHERAHLAQGDPVINAVAALLQCVSWFNPMVHVAVRMLRVDQELACDAAVLARAPTARRPYAEALLKTQAAGQVVPLGCAWPSPTLDAFKERIVMMKRNLPSRAQTILGVTALAAATVWACALAWSAQPPRVITIEDRAVQKAEDAATFQLARLDEGRFDVNIAYNPDEELAGGAEEAVVSAREITEEVRAAIAEAREEIAAARLEIEREAREAAAEDQANAEDMRAIAADAMEAARLGIEEARRELRVSSTIAIVSDGQSPAAMQLQHHAQALAAQALEFAALAMSDRAMSDSQRAAAEAEIALHAQRISELAMQVEAEERADADRVRVRVREIRERRTRD